MNPHEVPGVSSLDYFRLEAPVPDGIRALRKSKFTIPDLKGKADISPSSPFQAQAFVLDLQEAEFEAIPDGFVNGSAQPAAVKTGPSFGGRCTRAPRVCCWICFKPTLIWREAD